jgi:serine/threonine-protein kinase
MAVAFKHLSEALVPPRKFNPNLPAAVDKVIVKALSKEPDLRYQTVDELVTAFREAVEGAKTPIIKYSTPHGSKAQSKPQAARSVQASPTPPPTPVPLETIWLPTEERPARSGKGWVLLATIAGALVSFFLLFWAVAALLDRLL